MNTQKMAGYVLYAIGIIGGVEGATMVPRSTTGTLISVVAIVVIVIGAYLLEK
jgi:hypothetical protein